VRLPLPGGRLGEALAQALGVPRHERRCTVSFSEWYSSAETRNAVPFFDTISTATWSSFTSSISGKSR
jgi:hypothetical protein